MSKLKQSPGKLQGQSDVCREAQRIGKDQAFMRSPKLFHRFHWPPFPSISIGEKQTLHKTLSELLILSPGHST